MSEDREERASEGSLGQVTSSWPPPRVICLMLYLVIWPHYSRYKCHLEWWIILLNLGYLASDRFKVPMVIIATLFAWFNIAPLLYHFWTVPKSLIVLLLELELIFYDDLIVLRTHSMCACLSRLIFVFASKSAFADLCELLSFNSPLGNVYYSRIDHLLCNIVGTKRKKQAWHL